MPIDMKEQSYNSEKFRSLLFAKGFLITDALLPDMEQHPFYGNWRVTEIMGYRFALRRDVEFYHVQQGGECLFLIGHAYDPFAGRWDENEILRSLTSWQDSAFWEHEADLTGVYVMGRIAQDGTLYHWSDCAGMRISYYGRFGSGYYISSHANLVASLCNLEEDPYISRLKNSRYFPLFGNVLPGDLSAYEGLKRTVPNHVYGSDGSCERFYPIEPVRECESKRDYEAVVKESAEILRRTMALCAQKWREKRLYISLSGGKDSGETFASVGEHLDDFRFFSYISKPEEAADAYAARDLCREMGVEHRLIRVPRENDQVEDYGMLRELIFCNGGNIGYIRPNEVRKRCVLIQEGSIDVEVKSWVNEIVRAYWYKKYGKTKFPAKPNGRLLASLYKIFLENRCLLAQTSRVFEDYIRRYMTDADIAMVGDWTTLWSWEFGFSAGEGHYLTEEHLLSFDVTVPFNNRRLISLMLRPKREDRIADRLQSDVIRVNNPRQAQLGSNVVNAAHTANRARLERLYLWLNTHLPF